MDKIKKIGAIICVAIIALSYLVTIVSVFLNVADWEKYLYASIFVTVVFPIILYGMLMLAKIIKGKDEE